MTSMTATNAAYSTPTVAVVTGADSGIGRATAVALARQGRHLGITWHRDRPGAERTAEEVRALGRRCELEQMDLTRLPEAAEAVDRLADRLGRIDVLANNAGTGTATAFIALDPGTVRGVLDVDLFGSRRKMSAPVGPIPGTCRSSRRNAATSPSAFSRSLLRSPR
ncbi:hypothetical protein ACZ90_20305 [Streptomyces albus subsp. albus]|nr:hypothetical protein ACZ90_20305 [Streptomyces albus subsp. albus]